jgi:hypothetical protein
VSPADWTGDHYTGSLHPLAAFTKLTLDDAATGLHATLQPRAASGAQVLAEDGGRPLLVMRTLGRGLVYALGSDPAAAPLSTWAYAGSFWRALFAHISGSGSFGKARRTTGSYNGSYYGGSYPGDISPFEQPAQQLPGIGLIGGFLLLYVITVGPINYFILRRRSRLDWAWLTIPAIILLFVGGAYALGYSSKGSRLRLTTGTIVQTVAGSPVATVEGFAGLFAPIRQGYDLQFAGDALISPLQDRGTGLEPLGSGPVVYGGTPSGVRGLQMDPWTSRGFLAEATLPYTTPFTGGLQWAGDTIKGTVQNSGPALADVAVVYGGAVQLLGALPQGGQAGVNLPHTYTPPEPEVLLNQLLGSIEYSSWGQQITAEQRLVRRRAALLDFALTYSSTDNTGEVLLLGWGAPDPLAAGVAGEDPLRESLVLVLGTVPVTGTPALAPTPLPDAVPTGAPVP